MENLPNIFLSLSDDSSTQKLLCSENCGAQYTRLSATRLESFSFSSSNKAGNFRMALLRQSKEGKDYKINLIFPEFSHKFLSDLNIIERRKRGIIRIKLNFRDNPSTSLPSRPPSPEQASADSISKYCFTHVHTITCPCHIFALSQTSTR